MLLKHCLVASTAHIARKPQIITLISHRAKIFRFLGSQEQPPVIGIVDYDYVKKLPCEPQKLLIDVREKELQETVQIPTSINIPLALLCQDLTASKSIFECTYGREKPQLDTEIIFHCRSGKRSLQAAESAVALGFRKVKSYEGSWLDWAKKESGLFE